MNEHSPESRSSPRPGVANGQAELLYVVVFMPAYNESAIIGDVIKKIRDQYTETAEKGYRVDVLVIDDGSVDETAERAMEAGAVHVVSHPANRGLGAAIRTGLQTAHEMGADIAVKIDADNQYDPMDVDRVVRPVLEGKADAVFGSRLTGGVKYRMPLYRAAGNRFFSFLVSFLTGLKITDAQTGLMAFHRRYIAKFEIVSDYNATQQLIMDAWAKHFRIMEVPIVFHPRTTGESFISIRYPFKVIPTIFRMLVRGNPLLVFTSLGLFLVILGVAAGIRLLVGEGTFYGDSTVAILIIGGLQTFFFGLLADTISRK